MPSAKAGDQAAKLPNALTPYELRRIACQIEQRHNSGLAIPGDRVGLYAKALRALARERTT